MSEFTKKEIEVLKELAKERIMFKECFGTDDKGKEYLYRNRFETWDDAYNNLKAFGMGHDAIIKSIGEKRKGGKINGRK